jgi:hypothetical protein
LNSYPQNTSRPPLTRPPGRKNHIQKRLPVWRFLFEEARASDEEKGTGHDLCPCFTYSPFNRCALAIPGIVRKKTANKSGASRVVNQIFRSLTTVLRI